MQQSQYGNPAAFGGNQAPFGGNPTTGIPLGGGVNAGFIGGAHAAYSGGANAASAALGAMPAMHGLSGPAARAALNNTLQAAAAPGIAGAKLYQEQCRQTMEKKVGNLVSGSDAVSW